MKRITLIFVVIAVALFFILPTAIYADGETNVEGTEEVVEEAVEQGSEEEPPAEEPAGEEGAEEPGETNEEEASGEEETAEGKEEGSQEESADEGEPAEEPGETTEEASGEEETAEEENAEGQEEVSSEEEPADTEEPAEQQASVSTEQEKYHPGDIVPLTGTGFTPGEEVEIAFYNADDELEHIGRATADENGNILYEYQISGSTQYTVIVKAEGSEAVTEFDDDAVADYVGYGPSSRHQTRGLSTNFLMEYFIVDIYQDLSEPDPQDDDMYAFCIDLEHYLNGGEGFEWEVMDFNIYNHIANGTLSHSNVPDPENDTIYELPWKVKALAMGIDKDWVNNGSELSWLSDSINTTIASSSVKDRAAALQAAFWHLADSEMGNTRFDYVDNAPNNATVQAIAGALINSVINIPATIDLVNTESGQDQHTEINYIDDQAENTHSFTATVKNLNGDVIEGTDIAFNLQTDNANVVISENSSTSWTGTTDASGQVNIPILFNSFNSGKVEALSVLQAIIDINSSYISAFTTPGGSILFPLDEDFPETQKNSNQALIVIDEEDPDDVIAKIWRLPGEIIVQKLDETNDEPLNGAEFQLLDWEGDPALDAWGNSVANQLSGSYDDGNGTEGQALFSGLAWGEYQVLEVTPPTGYEINNTPAQVTVRGGESSTVSVSTSIADPRIEGSITIYKVDDLGRPVEGATFTLYNSGGGVVATGSGSVVTFTGLEWGTYTISETTVPSGFRGASDQTVTINASNAAAAISITMVNDPIIPPPPTTTTTTGGIEVLGITELPFTGMNPFIPLSGMAIVVMGLAIFILSYMRKRENRWKHAKGYNDNIKD